MTQRMRAGLIEETRYPRNPLDVLAQQLVAMCAVDEWHVDELRAVVRRVANFAELSDDVFVAVLDLLSGRYPSDDFAELRPRLVWDRTTGIVRAREGAGRIAITNGGTIPDRGLFGVFLPDGTRVGELDEEMVYESRRGEVFVLGASSWRIEDITRDRVVVVARPGRAGQDAVLEGRQAGPPARARPRVGRVHARAGRRTPRPSRSRGCATTSASTSSPRRTWSSTLTISARRPAPSPTTARSSSSASATSSATGGSASSRRSAQRVHAPWAHGDRGAAGRAVRPRRAGALERRRHRDPPARGRGPDPARRPAVRSRRDRGGGRARRCPAPRCSPARSARRRRARCCSPAGAPASARRCGSSASARADLLAAAAKHPTFPMLLETTRECLRDVFDVPALREVMADLRSRQDASSSPSTPSARRRSRSRCCSGGSPSTCTRATRRSRSAAPPRSRSTATCCASCSATEELRDLLDPARARRARARAAAARRGAPGAERRRRARPAASRVGDLPRTRSRRGPSGDAGRVDRAAARGRPRDPGARRRRGPRLAAVEDAARAPRRARRVAPDRPARRVHRADRPAARDAGRPLRAHARAVPAPARSAARLGAGAGPRPRRARRARGRPAASCTASSGPGGVEREWCDADVLRRLRRRSLAALRKEVEPVDAADARAVPPGVAGRRDRRRAARDALVDAIARLQGAAVPASILEHDVLPARVRGYRPADLDALCASGDLVWIGAGPLGADDGRVVAVRPRPGAAARAAAARRSRPTGELHVAIREHLARARRLVLARSGPGGGHRRRARRARRALGPGLGGRGHERHAGAAPGVDGEAVARDAASRLAGRDRGRCGARGRRPAPAAGRSSRPLLGAGAQPHRGRPRASAAAARSPRRAHTRGGAVRGRARRVRRRLRRAEGAGDVGQGPARVLRRRPRRGAVRRSGRRRSHPGAA